MAADPREAVVRAKDHRDGVPADDPPDPLLELLVAREVRLLLRADRVDVARLGQRRQADVELARALEQLVDEEAGAALALLLDDLVEGGEPFLGLGRVDVGQLVLEFVEVHGSWAPVGAEAHARLRRIGVGRIVRPV